MRYCKNCGHEIRRVKGVYKHRMVIVTNRTRVGVVLRVYCTNNKCGSHTKTCKCIKPEESK